MTRMKRLFSLVLTVVFLVLMVLALMPVTAWATQSGGGVAYAVTGGNIYFDPTTGYITGCDDTVTEVVIPNEIGGVSVIGIAMSAFKSCKSQFSVTIPNSITKLDNAFIGCNSLTGVTLPSTVTDIDGAFSHCTSLVGIIIPESVTVIGPQTFYNCTSLICVAIPDSVTEIWSSAFSLCEDLTDVYYGGSESQWNQINMSGESAVLANADIHYNVDTSSINIPQSTNTVFPVTGGNIHFDTATGKIKDSDSGVTEAIIPIEINGIRVTSIGNNAFMNSLNMTTVSIPDGVTAIGEGAFHWCQSLTSVTIPNSVTTIGESAFLGCINLTDAVISGNITSIERTLFCGCRSLTSVTIPSSVTSIKYAAFDSCNNLTDVYYGGSESQWNQIAISSNNDPLTNATIHYSAAPSVSEDNTPQSSNNIENGNSTVGGSDIVGDTGNVAEGNSHNNDNSTADGSNNALPIVPIVVFSAIVVVGVMVMLAWKKK